MKNADLKERVRAMILKDGKVLVVREKDGFVGLPGGHIRYAESPRDAMIRELVEELNIPEDVLFSLVPQDGFKRDLPDESTIFVFELPENIEILPSDEIKDFEFVKFPFTDSNGNTFESPNLNKQKNNSVHKRLNDAQTEASIAQSIDRISSHLGQLGEHDRGDRIKEMEQEAENVRLLIDDLKAAQYVNESKTIEDEELIEYTAEDTERKNYISHEGGKWTVHAESGKEMGTYKTKEEALKRLREIEYFKHHKKNDDDGMENSNIKHEDGKCVVHAKSGKEMGTYDTKKKAQDRLRQVELFGLKNECKSCGHDYVKHGEDGCKKCDCHEFDNSEVNMCECGHSYGKHGADDEPCKSKDCQCAGPRIGKPTGGSMPIPDAIY
jgi:ADP-ribose pyrophosphatase YjhB (NUDIX family)